MTDKEKAMLEALPPGPPEQSRAWCQGFRSGWDVALSASSGWVSVSENRLSDGGVYWITFVIEGQYVVSERTYRPDEFPSNTVAYMQAPKPAEPFTPRGEQSMSDKCKCGHGEKYHHDGKGIWAKGCNQPLAMELGCPCTQFTPADDPAPDMVEKAREFAAQGDHGVDEYWLATKLADFAVSIHADLIRENGELKFRDAELSDIEFALSRRTALDGCETTKDKILLMLKLCTELDPNGKKAFAALEDK